MDSYLKKFPQVKTCCCKCSLETGCNILGWIHFVSSIFIFVMTVTFCTVLLATWKTSTEHHEATSIMFAFVLSALVATVVGIDIFLAVFLLYAIYKGDLNKIKIWLYMEIILLSVNSTVRFVNFIGLLDLDAPSSELYGNFAQNTIELCFIFYFITVVKSYYYEKTGMSYYEEPTEQETTDVDEKGDKEGNAF